MAWGRALAVFLLGWALVRWILPSFYPFFFALVFAAWVQPLVEGLDRRGVPRSLASLAAIGILVALALGTLALLAGGLLSEATRLLGMMPHYYAEARRSLLTAGGELGLLGPGGLSPKDGEAPLRTVFSFASQALGEIVRGMSRLPELALGMAVAVIAAYFLARDRLTIAQKAERSLPRPVFRWSQHVFGAFWRTSVGYLKAQMLLVLLTAALTTAGLALLGSPYAVVLGLTAGVLDLVPLLGPTAVLLPWGVYLLLTGSGPFGIRVLALLAVVVGIREIVESRIVGGGVGLHPLAALAAMYLGVRLFGPLGVAFGPILVAAAWAIARSPQEKEGSG